MPTQSDPAELARIQARLRIAVPAVFLPMVIWSVFAALFGVWPGSVVEHFLMGWIGFTTFRTLFTGTFVLLGLGVLAVLLPLVIVVNVVRKMRG